MIQSVAAQFSRPGLGRLAAPLAGMPWGGLAYSFRVGIRYVSLALALVLWTAVLVGLVGIQMLNGLARTSTQHRLNQGQITFESVLRERARGLESLAFSLDKDRGFLAAALDSPNRSDVLNVLALGGADFVAFQPRQGGMRVAPQELGPLVAHALDQLGPIEDGHESGSPRLLRASDGTFVWTSRAVASNGDHLIAGYFLGQAFADQFASRTGLDLTLFANDKTLVTSLHDMEGNPASDIGNPQAMAAALTTGAVTTAEFSLAGTQSLAVYFPLYQRETGTVGGYLLSVPIPKALGEGLDGGSWPMVLLAGLLLTASGAAAVLVTRIVGPVKGLQQAVSRIEHGDLATPVNAGASPEVAPLVRNVEEMRRSLLRAHNELAIERSLYKSTFRAMADGVFTSDQSGAITSANPALLGLLGQESPEALGTRCCGQTVLRDKEGRSLCDLACTWLWLKGEAEPVLVKGYLEAGTEIPRDIEMTVTPIKDEEQRTVALVHVIRDVSADEQLQRLKERFLMSVSHELCTPLAALASSVEILGGDVWSLEAEDRTRLLDTVGRNTERLRALTTNLLDLGSIQAGSFTVNIEATRLTEPIEQALALSEPLLAARGQQAKLHAPPDLPLVRADTVRIVQVLTNLIGNAAKYGPASDTIIVSAEDAGPKVRVAVTDHGAGISPEDKQRIFDYFYRGQATSRSEKGFGVGLAITQGIVKAHKGEIGVTSEPGEGTSFWFTLPKDL